MHRAQLQQREVLGLVDDHVGVAGGHALEPGPHLVGQGTVAGCAAAVRSSPRAAARPAAARLRSRATAPARVIAGHTAAAALLVSPAASSQPGGEHGARRPCAAPATGAAGTGAVRPARRRRPRGPAGVPTRTSAGRNRSASNRSRTSSQPLVRPGRCARRAQQAVEGRLVDAGLAQRRQHRGHEAQEAVARTEHEDAVGGDPGVVVDEPRRPVEADDRLARARPAPQHQPGGRGRGGRARPARSAASPPRPASRCHGCGTARSAAATNRTPRRGRSPRRRGRRCSRRS